MSFVELSNFNNPPERECPEKSGGIFAVWKPGVLEGHDRLGYSYRPNACHEVLSYDPDVCVPGDLKMDPQTFPPAKEAVLGMIQSAFNCSVGASMDELRAAVRDALDDNLQRAVETDLVAELDLTAVSVGTDLDAKCVLAEAAQWLATNSECGRGVILGPVGWLTQLTDLLIWNGKYHTDYVGNIVVPSSVDNDTVYAFDNAVEIKVSDVLLMDELAPGVRNVNDKIVRAEQLYTIAVDSCQIAKFTVAECCGCGSSGGGGGGGGGVQNPCNCQFTVTNFPATQDVNVVSSVPLNVTVSNFPVDSEFDVEELLLCDDNGAFIHRSTYNAETGAFVSAVNTDLTGAPYAPVGTVKDCGTTPPATPAISQHFDVLPGTPWTPALVAGTLTSVTYTVWVGTATVTDSNGTVVAGIPQGHSSTWQHDLENAIVGPTSIDADPGSRVYVNWTEK